MNRDINFYKDIAEKSRRVLEAKNKELHEAKISIVNFQSALTALRQQNAELREMLETMWQMEDRGVYISDEIMDKATALIKKNKEG